MNCCTGIAKSVAMARAVWVGCSSLSCDIDGGSVAWIDFSRNIKIEKWDSMSRGFCA